MPLMNRTLAEFLGTFLLVFGGCGSAVLAAAFPEVGIGLVGVSLAFGLTVLTMAYAVGRVSGGHFNPAVTVGLLTARRIPAADLVPYMIAQLAGAIAASAVLLLIASGKPGYSLAVNGFAANGYGDHSPGGYSMLAAFVIETVLTFFFLLIILGSTEKRAPQGFGPLAHWTRVNFDSPHQYSRNQHLCESSAQSWTSRLCWWLGTNTTVAFLGGADNWCCLGRSVVSVVGPRNGKVCRCG